MNKFNWGMRVCVLFLLWVGAAVSLPAQTFKTLHSFDGTDGAGPAASLVQATNGNLYGTTESGGTGNCSGGCGTIFKISPSGRLTTLYKFCSRGGNRCTDGELPVAGLVQGTDGNFYGTTYYGGANSCNVNGYNGCGTVFKITPGGKLTTLHSFNNTDGAVPASLIQATNGALYGTAGGGANGAGTVFTITPGGVLTTLYNFCSQINCTDGDEPNTGLIQATDGNFYGTTFAGGANNTCVYAGCGTVFTITPGGVLTTLYSFCSQINCTDGDNPLAGLVQGTDGNLYGTTFEGGTNACPNGCGTVFTITPGGALTTLHSFDGTDGANTYAGLVQATNGNFYGTMSNGGPIGAGTIFTITPSGMLTTLQSFDLTDGANPNAGLVQDTNGTFYGTTGTGGANSVGTIFSLSVGLGPFVATQLASGQVGAAVKILGTNLTGATSVTFNGTPATFKVKSKSEITTTVPTGATTGTVQVVTPGGTLSSNVPSG